MKSLEADGSWAQPEVWPSSRRRRRRGIDAKKRKAKLAHHYAYLTGAEGKSALDAEFPPGKRTYPNYQPGQMKVGEI